MSEMRLAGFWQRFVAVLIDGVLIYIVNIILTLVGVGYLSIVVGWLYFALMESSTNQATLGKRVMKLKVTDLNGNRISFGRATGRYFSKIVSSLILCIGYIMAAFTEKKQALHDMMAGTLVYAADGANVTTGKSNDLNALDNDFSSSNE